jgi:sigma-B regulation protein RsbU (phosphoserine phosphatase)
MAADPGVMQCMEVWGGNQTTDDSVAVAGLDAWVYCRPFGQADGGGDVYYVSSCATGRIARLLLADVSGHGETVKTVAIELRDLMRRSVNQLDHTRFLHSMNRQFGALVSSGSFATAIVSTFFAPTGRLRICNAGHPIPIHFKASTSEWRFLENAENERSTDPVNLPLGILEFADYRHFDVALDSNDYVLCYTDSLVEARQADGELLGHEGLMAIVRSVPVTTPERFIPDLLAAIAVTCKDTLDNDDVTVLLFRPNGQGRRPTFKARAAGAGRLARAIGRSLRPGGEPVPWPDFNLSNIGGMMLPRLQRAWKPRER